MLAWLALLPLFAGVTLMASRIYLPGQVPEGPRRAVRIARVAVSMATAASLGLGAVYGLVTAKRFLADDDADAPLQLIGAIGLLYASASAVVMIGVLALAARDALKILRGR